MRPQEISAILFALVIVALVFVVTWMMDRHARLRKRFDQVVADNVKLRGFMRSLGVTPTPIPPPGDREL